MMILMFVVAFIIWAVVSDANSHWEDSLGEEE